MHSISALRQRYFFPLAIFLATAALSYVLYPYYLQQGPFILFFVAVSLNAARRGKRAGVITGVSSAIFAAWMMTQGPHGLSFFSLILFLLASFLISHQLGRRREIEVNLKLENEERKRIEAHLKNQEENLRLALSSEKSGMWEWDIASNKVTWSPELERIRGLSPGTFEGTFEAAKRDIHPADLDRFQQSVRAAIKSGQPFSVSYRFIKPTGEIAWAESHGSFRFDERGKPIRLIGLCTDVTSHKLAAEINSRLSAIVTSSADAIISESLEGKIMTWNEGAERIFGYSASEVLGKHVSILAPKDRLDEPSHMIDALQRGQGLYQVETRRMHKCGRLIHVSISVSPVRDAQGDLIGISKIARDISTRKKNQERESYLKDSSDLLSSSLDYESTLRLLANFTIQQIADWCTIYVVNDDGSLKRIAIVHKDPEEAQKAAEFDNVYPPDPTSERGLLKVIRTGEAEICPSLSKEVIARFARDETHFQYLNSLNLKSGMIVPFNAHGKTFGAMMLVSSNEDILYGTQDLALAQELGRRAGLSIENSRLYQAAQKAREAADQSSRAKSAFLANMSHEIRTPLGAILGFTELLVTTDQSPVDRQESLEVITRNGKLLSNIINDILDLTKVESGRLDVEKIPVSLVPLFEETRSSLSLLALEKGIGLSLTFDDGLQSNIVTDPLRLKQILINIIGNAIKFTSVGGVTVNVRSEVRANTTDLLIVDVKDTGKGLSPDEIDKLFSAFSQADASTTRNYGGTGLGLALSRQLARALGGDVQLLLSEPGIGSTFSIVIDTGINSLDCRVIDIQSAAQFTRSKAAGPNLEGLRVLVVEDAKDNQLLMSRILKLNGAYFDIAENGAVGVEKAMAGNFDVILMDVQMPVMDGFQAMLELRKRNYSGPIIALTAHAMREDRDLCLDRGFDDHMSKPVDRGKLKELLAAYRNGGEIEEPVLFEI